MAFKFVLKCIIREKWLVDNELIKGVAETFSIKTRICFVFSLNTLVVLWMQLYEWCHKYVFDVVISCKIEKKNYCKLQFIWENESN